MSIIDCLKNRQECIWINPNKEELEAQFKLGKYGFVYMKAAQNRFMRFLPYFASAYPETRERKGVIESNLISIPKMKEAFNDRGASIEGQVFLKDDAHLPIAGSVKARGGIHEVIAIAESLAQKAGKLHPTDKYDKLNSKEFYDFYHQYTIQVGSTGNLGLSIGRSAARLGFKVIVHMSRDAKEWKKELLRKEGVVVKEYEGDYSLAVAQGRKESQLEENSFFIDDENSQDLFFGYSSAAMRLSVQLRKLGIPVNKEHPLFVYLPCGVGGAPGGITFGLKQMFGNDVHCFFGEPVASPCMFLGLASGKGNEISVEEIGLDGKTIADGLAVGRASAFVCQMMTSLVSGCYTVADERLLNDQKMLYDLENVFLEPSACAGFLGLESIQCKDEWKEYLEKNHLTEYMKDATHVIWGTGGGLMPEEERWL